MSRSFANTRAPDDDTLSAAVSIGFHGLAFAMVLYLISVGLSVTMGLMGFVNLAHGVFAMARRLCADEPDEPLGRAVRAGAARRGGGGRRWRAFRSSACSTAGSMAATSSTRCC